MDDIQIPPHSLDFEIGVLSGILHYPELMSQAVGILQPEHFYNPVHQKIFIGMLDCFAKQAPIEPGTISAEMAVSGELDRQTIQRYMLDLLLSGSMKASVIDAYSLKYWTKKLVDLARRRELITVCHDLRESAVDTTDSTYMEQAENLVFLLSQAYPDAEEPTSAGYVDEAMSTLQQELSAPNGLTGLSTGFYALDKATHGFQPYQLITLSARPGGGKSAFALNVASHVVLKERKPVLYISLEMTSAELMKRLIKARAGTDMNFNRLNEAAQFLRPYQKDFMLEDAAGQTLAAIQSKILKAKKQRPELGLIVVDHIGLIASDPKARAQNRAYEIQAVTSRLKTLAKTVQTPILQLAQMNRQVDVRQDKKPVLSDLRDSGSIEMDSDIVLFTHIERDEDRKATGEATLTVAKQRDGVQMDIPLSFTPHLTLFRDSSVTRI